jgi:putative oxidoreductase
MDLVALLTNPFGADALDWPGHLEWALVPLRITVAVIMLDSGIGKWRRGISGTGRWFAGLGLPFAQPLARFVATVEVVGGALLFLGLLVHVAAVFIAVNMTAAAFVQKFRAGAPFQGGDVQGYELDVLLAMAAVTLVLGGAGPLSVDALIW